MFGIVLPSWSEVERGRGRGGEGEGESDEFCKISREYWGSEHSLGLWNLIFCLRGRRRMENCNFRVTHSLFLSLSLPPYYYSSHYLR